MTREDHPFDRGYWRRYDGLPRPKPFALERSGLRPFTSQTHEEELVGWDTCDDELRLERR